MDCQPRLATLAPTENTAPVAPTKLTICCPAFVIHCQPLVLVAVTRTMSPTAGAGGSVTVDCATPLMR